MGKSEAGGFGHRVRSTWWAVMLGCKTALGGLLFSYAKTNLENAPLTL